jgi:molybdopterin molybdotransferase
MTPSSLSAPLSVVQTQQEIAALVAKLRINAAKEDRTQTVSTEDLLGRVLSVDLISPINVPAHDNSAMDGYALRYADLVLASETVLPITGSIFAGDQQIMQLPPHAAMKIMTGAMMPGGADVVVPFENATSDELTVTVPAGLTLGQNRRFAGEDLTKNHVALPKHKRCGPAEMGLIASLGIAQVEVFERLKVAIFSTGNELADFGQTLQPGQVFDSNRYTLKGMLAKLDVNAIDLGIVRDDPTALEATLRLAMTQADIVISSGGVSVGEADFTRSVMAKLGSIDFCTVAMRPGRPLAVGVIGENKLYFGLPGNPVAVMMTFYFFVQAAIRQLAGEQYTTPPLMQAISQSAFRKKPGRTEYQRAYVTSEVTSEGNSATDRLLQPTVRSTGHQGSGVLSSMSHSNCLVVLHHEQGSVAAGDLVNILTFSGLL